MTRPEQQTVALQRPENKGAVDRSNGGVKPYELDPELMQLKIAELMVNKLGTPSILDKPFAVRYGIFTALNHGKYTNPTGYDSSLRLAVYREYAAQSVNEDGVYFHNFWAWLNKPKYVVQAGNALIGQAEEKKESVVGRIVGWFRGGKKNEQQQQ